MNFISKFLSKARIKHKPIQVQINLLSVFQPYRKPKPKELSELEQWKKNNPINKDYVFQIPENYKKPSLYNPSYLGKKTSDSEVEYNLNDNENEIGLTYAEKGDEPKVNVVDINPNHNDEFDIMSNIESYIGNLEKLPVGDIIFSQNNNTMEVMQFIKGGMRSEFQRNSSPEAQRRGQKLRQNAKKKSRIKANEKSARLINNKTGTFRNWHWTHLIPIGYHGSESDERLGVRWWGEDNSKINDGNGKLQEFEDKQAKRDGGFYWLTRILKYDDGRYSGLVWEYKIFSKEGDLLDEERIEHLERYRDEVNNVWSDQNSDTPWAWNFGIDTNVSVSIETVSSDEDEEEDEYNFSTEKFAFESKTSPCVVSFGQDSNGNLVTVDLSSPEACHVLIVGTTGSGKSVQVNSLISQLMAHNTPQQVQFLGIDPKMTEFAQYKDCPYFAINPVLDTNEAIMLVRYALAVSETRSAMFSEIGVKNLTEYNEWVASNSELAMKKKFGFLPELFLFTDEFASLMAQNGQEVEGIFNRIVAEGRAQGVHAILATQRPSVDVISGTMKNNFPCKNGLSMGSSVDSSTLMEVEENDINPHQLKGRGDNILKTQNKRVRLQGYFVSQADSEHILKFLAVMYYGVTKIKDKVAPNYSKFKQVNYLKHLEMANLVECVDGKYTLIKKKG